jgi:hypothetical protein
MRHESGRSKWSDDKNWELGIGNFNSEFLIPNSEFAFVARALPLPVRRDE